MTCCFSETEKQRSKEKQAALCIQTNWRMLRVKWRFQYIKKQTILIQKVYMAFVLRLTARRAYYNVKVERRLSFFTEQARIIQK